LELFLHARDHLARHALSRGRKPFGIPLFGDEPLEEIDAFAELADMITRLAELVDPLPFLNELAQRGVKAAVFEGAA